MHVFIFFVIPQTSLYSSYVFSTKIVCTLINMYLNAYYLSKEKESFTFIFQFKISSNKKMRLLDFCCKIKALVIHHH